MRLLFYFLVAIFFSSCKSTFQQKDFDYQGEHALITIYGAAEKEKPLLVVLPELNNSTLSDEILKKLSRKYQVVKVSFLSPNDKQRQIQLDNLNNRINFYSDYLNLLAVTHQDSMSILAEGLNANFISNYTHAFALSNIYLINPYKPNLHQVFTDNCYASATATCDSLLKYFGFTSRTELDSLLVAVKTDATDNKYGNHTLSFWRTVLTYDLKNNTKAGNKILVFTQESGLQGQNQKSKNTLIIKEEELKKTLLEITRN